MSIDSEVFEQFNTIPEPQRMLCTDAAFVGCWLFQNGHKEAGLKLLRTAITTAGLEVELIDRIINNLPESANALAKHTELRSLK